LTGIRLDRVAGNFRGRHVQPVEFLDVGRDRLVTSDAVLHCCSDGLGLVGQIAALLSLRPWRVNVARRLLLAILPPHQRLVAFLRLSLRHPHTYQQTLITRARLYKRTHN
jgi:hypothetical protein